jgi:hypothetical protein
MENLIKENRLIETSRSMLTNLSSNVVNEKTLERSIISVILITFLLSSICVMTLIGNLLVVIAVLTTKSLHTVTNSFIMSLAVADMLVAVFIMPLSIYMVNVNFNDWKFGDFTCDLWMR